MDISCNSGKTPSSPEAGNSIHMKAIQVFTCILPQTSEQRSFGKDQRKGREHPGDARMFHIAMGKQEKNPNFLAAWNPEQIMDVGHILQ